MKDDVIKEHIECACGMELLQLTYDNYFKQLFITYYTVGQKGNKYSLLNRLRHIWHIIRKGTPFDDFITFNMVDIAQLKKFINQIPDDKITTTNN